MGKIVIDSSKSAKLNFKDILEYKDLLWFLVIRDVKIIYKQTVLGFAWAIIQPLASMIIFTMIFGRFAGLEKELPPDIPYPVFAYVALVPWTYFSTALSASANSLVADSNLLSKVYFPRIIIPLTPVLAKLVDFFISLTILVILFAIFDITPYANRIIYLPLLIGMMGFTAMGAGLWLSALTLQYRDVRFLLSFIIQLLMFATPIIWPITLIPEKYRLVYALNPMVGIIEGFREAIIGKYAMPWDLLKMATLSSVILFITGYIYFRRKESYFADVA